MDCKNSGHMGGWREMRGVACNSYQGGNWGLWNAMDHLGPQGGEVGLDS